MTPNPYNEKVGYCQRSRNDGSNRQHPHWKIIACASAAAVLVLELFGCRQHKDLGDDIWNDLFHTGQPCMKNQDIVQGCERSLTRFFSKRASCSCLDEKYAAMKSQPKTCICMNCAQMKERRSMMYCTGCSSTQYCSRKCQVAHFPHHKEFLQEAEHGGSPFTAGKPGWQIVSMHNSRLSLISPPPPKKITADSIKLREVDSHERLHYFLHKIL